MVQFIKQRIFNFASKFFGYYTKQWYSFFFKETIHAFHKRKSLNAYHLQFMQLSQLPDRSIFIVL